MGGFFYWIMALRDQPYLPLYIQDFMTDEKLIECSAMATGVYIRLMCLMHKSEQYGKILLKQKDKQTDKPIKNFALKVAKNMPYDLTTIETALEELTQENVLSVQGDELLQKRMIKDCVLSIKRAESGKKGGQKSALKNDFANNFAQAKGQGNDIANSEYENEIEYEYVNEIDNKSKSGKIFKKPTEDETIQFFTDSNSTKNEAIKFYSYYESNGWKVGKNKMKDWKASARGWIMRTLTDQKNGKFQNGTSQHHLRNDSGVLDISAEHNRKGMERLGMIPKTAEA